MNDWRILTLHDVSWLSSQLADPLGGQLNPEQFECLLTELEQHFELISPTKAIAKINAGEQPKDWLSLWFDDGFSGVRNFALPLLQERGIFSVQSYTTQLLEGKPTWRNNQAASGLNHKQLTEKLDNGNFNAPLSAYNYWPFDGWEDPEILLDAGWEIGNHSVNHYPVAESSAFHLFPAEFEAADVSLAAHNYNSRFWVIPFDRKQHRVPQLMDQQVPAGKYLVFQGDRANDSQSLHSNHIYRYHLPSSNPSKVLKHLHG